MRALQEQTHKEFDIIMGPLKRLNENASRFRVQVPRTVKSFGETVDALVQNRTCRWIVTGRVDGDDYVEPTWLETVIQRLQENVANDTQLGGLTIASKSVKMVMFNRNENELLCRHFPPIQASGKQASIGLTTAIRKDVWDKLKREKFTAVDGPHFASFRNLQKVIRDAHYAPNVTTKMVHYGREMGMYTITKLSAHYSWEKHQKCDFKRLQRHYRFDVTNVVKHVDDVPNISQFDACKSNIMFRGNQRGLFKGKKESCEDMWNRKRNAINQSILLMYHSGSRSRV